MLFDSSPSSRRDCAKTPETEMTLDGEIQRLSKALASHSRWFVLTGAGCSTASGIAAYRDEAGRPIHGTPLTHTEFVSSEIKRKRYWMRSVLGWPTVDSARPNRAHDALVRLERSGRMQRLVTQNVDGLHQKAGSQLVTELHGRLRHVRCLQCEDISSRAALQRRLLERNTWLQPTPETAHQTDLPSARLAPDGDAAPAVDRSHLLALVACAQCGGVLMPDVVFFGGTVPSSRVTEAYDSLERSDALLVIGSSLTVFSGFRFVKRAVAWGRPIYIVNRGQSRADGLARLRLSGECGDVLSRSLALCGLDAG